MERVRKFRFTIAPLGTVLCGLVLTALVGCEGSTLALFEPAGVPSIKIGAARQAVQRDLGQPAESMATDIGRIDTYRYTRGIPEVPPLSDCAGGAFVSCVPFENVLHPVTYPFAYQEHRVELEIAYDANDKLIYAAACWTDRQPGRHIDARLLTQLAYLFEVGEGTARDYVQAYKWYTRAAVGQGEPSFARRDKLTAEMTAGQAEAVARMAERWGRQLCEIVSGA